MLYYVNVVTQLAVHIWYGVFLAATNINGALLTALRISELGRLSSEAQGPEPIIIFLTDGRANIEPREPTTIMTNVKGANTGNSSIFSLALGDEADFPFLKKLSLRSSGFARKIYEASDTALQLTDFYRQVASPLLANVTFSYQPDQVSVRLLKFLQCGRESCQGLPPHITRCLLNPNRL
jgi:hypothetical protein